MTVSLAEATAAARRMRLDAYAGDPECDDCFEDDARLLAGFVLAGDTERLRTALEGVLAHEPHASAKGDCLAAIFDEVRAALAEGSP